MLRQYCALFSGQLQVEKEEAKELNTHRRGFPKRDDRTLQPSRGRNANVDNWSLVQFTDAFLLGELGSVQSKD